MYEVRYYGGGRYFPTQPFILSDSTKENNDSEELTIVDLEKIPITRDGFSDDAMLVLEVEHNDDSHFEIYSR
jgi:hypothetical protein